MHYETSRDSTEDFTQPSANHVLYCPGRKIQNHGWEGRAPGTATKISWTLVIYSQSV